MRKQNVTQRNSNNMKTIVETYVIEETAELIYDDEKLTKWNSLVDELGLTGQTSIVTPTKSPIPFLHMKRSLVEIFQTLCPRALDVNEYNISPIPLDILELIALSSRENYFQKIQIWYDDKTPDPVCIGVNGRFYQDYWAANKKDEWYNGQFQTKDDAIAAGIPEQDIRFSITNHYLIGRWADVKKSFLELKNEAIERYTATRTNELNTQLLYYQRQLDDLAAETFSKFN